MRLRDIDRVEISERRIVALAQLLRNGATPSRNRATNVSGAISRQRRRLFTAAEA